MKNFMQKPITWGSYFKLCGISAIFSVVYTLVYWFHLKKTMYW